MQEINYTPSQENLIFSGENIITRALKEKTFHELRVIGSAGTGKTTIMKALVDKIIPTRKKICIAAPTHKALSVIKSKTDYEYRDGVKYATIASFLRMESKLDYATDQTVFTFSNKTVYSFLDTDILLVDEASMISKEQHDKIIELAKADNKIVIWVGDSKQLPPVGEKFSLATEEKFSDTCRTLVLTEIVRQGEGNPIIDISQNLDKVKLFENNVIDGKGYFYTGDRGAVVRNLAQGRGSDKIRFLAWRNDTVDAMNKQVRLYIYGPNPDDFYPGESIIVNGNGRGVKNNQEILIVSVQEKEMNIKLITRELYDTIKDDPKIKRISLTHPYLKFDDAGVLYVKVFFTYLNYGLLSVLKPSSEKFFNNAVKIMKVLYKNRKISYPQLLEFQEQFVKFKYGYAMSVHKSQGSTFENVIIDLKDVSKNHSEFNRMLYTAITRASNKVIFYYNKESNE